MLVKEISDSVEQYGSVAKTPLDKVQNLRNDMYLASEALRVLAKDKENELTAEEKGQIADFKKQLDSATKFIPLWVKICVAIALGLGTMVGWKRIVITVGEKIGKTHLTYGQGAAAELIAAATIGAADGFGLPVSTTHVLSSGVAGTMVANGSGMQWSTMRSIAMAWVLTLPAAMIMSGCAVRHLPSDFLTRFDRTLRLDGRAFRAAFFRARPLRSSAAEMSDRPSRAGAGCGRCGS